MSKRAREDEPSPTSHGMMSPIQHLATSVELISRRQEQAATQISSLQRQVATLNCRLTASGQQPPRLWPTGRLSAGNPSNTVQALGETQSQAFPETQVLSPAFPETQVYPQAQASPTAGDASAEDVLHHPSRTAEVHAEVQPALDSQVDEESQVQQFGAPPVPISALTPETFGAQLATSIQYKEADPISDILGELERENAAVKAEKLHAADRPMMPMKSGKGGRGRQGGTNQSCNPGIGGGETIQPTTPVDSGTPADNGGKGGGSGGKGGKGGGGDKGGGGGGGGGNGGKGGKGDEPTLQDIEWTVFSNMVHDNSRLHAVHDALRDSFSKGQCKGRLMGPYNRNE